MAITNVQSLSAGKCFDLICIDNRYIESCTILKKSPNRDNQIMVNCFSDILDFQMKGKDDVEVEEVTEGAREVEQKMVEEVEDRKAEEVHKEIERVEEGHT